MTWWALYDDGEPSEVWSFHPFLAMDTDQKLLTPYTIDSAELTDTELVIHVTGWGRIVGGDSWFTGKELSFDATPDGFLLARVRNAFTVGGGEVAVEAIHEDSYVKTTIAIDVNEPRCGLQFDDDANLIAPESWQEQERALTCAIQGRRGRNETRALDSRSFIERPVPSQ